MFKSFVFSLLLVVVIVGVLVVVGSVGAQTGLPGSGPATPDPFSLPSFPPGFGGNVPAQDPDAGQFLPPDELNELEQAANNPFAFQPPSPDGPPAKPSAVPLILSAAAIVLSAAGGGIALTALLKQRSLEKKLAARPIRPAAGPAGPAATAASPPPLPKA